MAEEAEAEEESGDLEAAEQGYREALEKDATNRDAGVGLGRILAERGDLDEARVAVTPFLPDPDAERVLATVRVKGWSDLDEVGTLASAKRLAVTGHWREALDAMMGSLMDDRDEATAAMRDVFAVLGDDDPLVPSSVVALKRVVLTGGIMGDVHDQIRDFWDRDSHTYDDSASHAISDPLEAWHGARRSCERCRSAERRCSMPARAPARSACSPLSSGTRYGARPVRWHALQGRAKSEASGSV